MRNLTTSEDLKELYEKDFYMWVYENLKLLKEGKYDRVDWENLLEEIEDMGKTLKRSLISYIAVILEHMYKLENLLSYSRYDTDMLEEGGRGWKRSIANASIEIEKILDDSPGLLRQLEDITRQAWKYARKSLTAFIMDLEEGRIVSISEREQLLRSIPKELPYTIEQIAGRITELTEDENNAFAQYMQRYKKGQKPGKP
ncbi:DUF29 domain-containing protein [Hydrogenobacter thermophilus]|uniref:DUF29 domain-containing protein n=1 Tax=Hydrogenobacter thermophilus TaxID=940 RepID=UPI0030F65335